VPLDPRQRILSLVRLARDSADGAEKERATAAMKVCELLELDPALLADVPLQGTSRVHPAAEARRRWRRMVAAKNLWQDEWRDDEAGSCASCGKEIHPGDNVVGHRDEDLMTHEGCKDWWYGFEPAPPPERKPFSYGGDDDIPF
jgi:hypothetical protein